MSTISAGAEPTLPGRLNRRSIPNIELTDQHGGAHRFYDDLAQNRVILLSFTSLAHDAELPVTAKLAQLCAWLDQRQDNRVSVYSITVDPGRDIPKFLTSFASRFKPSKRWLFLSGEKDDIDMLRSAFFVERGTPSTGAGPRLYRRADILHLGHHPAGADCSLGLLRYGDEALDLWGAVPAAASVRDIAMRLSWLRGGSTERPARRRRAGPNAAIRA